MTRGTSLPSATEKVIGTRRGQFIGFVVVAAVVLSAVVSACVASRWTAFGAEPKGERLRRAQQSPQWHDGKFENPQPIWADTRAAWRRFLLGPSVAMLRPDGPVPVVHDDASTFATPPASGLRITWFGHSSALVEIDGRNILIDPFWSQRASPVSWAGPERWYPPPIALSELPRIDAVLISHDHYDHLDPAAVVAMTSWTTVFIVPLGVGAHLQRWGIPQQRILELDWWQSAGVGTIEVVATPARHASGRLATKSNRTLWAGYAIAGTQHRVWYSGDTGFHNDLRRIGEQLGPFDVSLIEAGQYDANWPDTHLGPEQAVEAHRLVRGKLMIPVHWGMLSLAEHAWTEPAERVIAEALCSGVEALVPRPGESVEPTLNPTTVRWWPDIPWQRAEQTPVNATRFGNATDRFHARHCLVQ